MEKLDEAIKQEELDLENLPDGEEDEEEDPSNKGDYQSQLLKASQKGCRHLNSARPHNRWRTQAPAPHRTENQTTN